MWLVNAAFFVVLVGLTLIVGALASVVAGISWVVNWIRTREQPLPQAHYSDRR